MRKCAGESVSVISGQNAAEGRAARSYRVIAIAPGLAPITIRVTGECVTTGKGRTMDFFLVNRVEVREEAITVEDPSKMRVRGVDRPRDLATSSLALCRGSAPTIRIRRRADKLDHRD